MKVFKFTSGDVYYGYSGHDENEAKEAMFDDMGETSIDSVEEIPESEWDKKVISMWEDNDFETEPYKVSIRENMIGETPILLFTNDLDF